MARVWAEDTEMETECETDILEMWLCRGGGYGCRVPLPAFLGKVVHVSPTSGNLCLSFLYTQHRALCWAHSTCSVNVFDLLNTCQVQSKDSGQTGVDMPGREDKKVRRHLSPRSHSRPSLGSESLFPETRTIRESSSMKEKSLWSQI